MANLEHRKMTHKSFMLTAPSCIDDSWRSTAMVETYLMNSEFGLVSSPFHPRFISYLTIVHRVMWPSKNPWKLFSNAKNDFKSKWKHDSTASQHTHPVCQYPSEDTVKLTSVWWRVFGTNRIIGTWHWSLGGNVTQRENYFEKWFINCLRTVHFFYIDPHIFFRYHVGNSYLHKKWNFDWNKNIVGKLVATNDPVIWFFFQYSMVLIPNHRCLVGGSRIRYGQSGTPTTIIYTRWSSWHEGLGGHSPMMCRMKSYVNQSVNHR